ncbi:MAG: hypothetical protein LBF12_05400 [Christensenellaceae bacterium]|nr:hypothetical protein [Christensenellaceae bacterium]
MKKLTIISILLILTIILSVNLTSCAKPISIEEGLKAFDEALLNSLKAELYYIKEKINDDGSDDNFPKYFNEKFINVYGEYKETEKDSGEYAAVKDENGRINDFTIFFKENINVNSSEVMLKRIFVGLSPSSKKNDSKYYLFTETKKDNVDDYTRNIQEMTPYEFFDSDSFAPYKLRVFLKELLRLDHSDMLFVSKDPAIKNGVGITLKFNISDEYLENYKNEFGTVSRLSGNKYVKVEIINNKISQLTVFRDGKIKNTDATIEVEPYTLSITYLGPIIKMPKYDRSDWYNDSLM